LEKLIGRKEVSDRLKISKAHIARLFKKYGIKPVEQNIYQQKLLYKLKDVEEAFGLKIGGGILYDPDEKVDTVEEVRKKEADEKFDKEIDELLNED